VEILGAAEGLGDAEDDGEAEVHFPQPA